LPLIIKHDGLKLSHDKYDMLSQRDNGSGLGFRIRL